MGVYCGSCLTSDGRSCTFLDLKTIATVEWFTKEVVPGTGITFLTEIQQLLGNTKQKV